MSTYRSEVKRRDLKRPTIGSKTTSKFNKWLAIGGLVGTSLFIPIAFLIGETRDGYSHLSQGISALSATGAPDAWAQTANFLIVGLLLMGLAVGLRRGMSEIRASFLASTLIAVFGLVVIMNGVFPADPVGAPETLVGTVHSLSAGLGFLAVIAAMFVLSSRFVEHEEWQNLSSLSRWFGIATIFLMVSYLMAQEGAVQAWHPWTGLLQRGMVAAVMVWLFLLALRLFQTSRGRE